jgi:hypothetical protein
VFDENGHELSESQLPSIRALHTGVVSASTVLGFYNCRLRRLRWMSVTSVPQFAAGSDRPHQVLSLFTDVTELKRDSALFDRAQALAHIGGWEWDTGRDSSLSDRRGATHPGRAPGAETVEEMLACLLDPDRHRLRVALDHACRSAAASTSNCRASRWKGRLFWVRVIGEAEPGNPIGSRITGTLQDITERRVLTKACAYRHAAIR